MVDTILRESIVLIDPLENPDGRRDSFSSTNSDAPPIPDGESHERRARRAVAGGRSNHYLFDMNRDWFAQPSRKHAGG